MNFTRQCRPRPLLGLFSLFLFTFTAVFAHAKDYTRIVVFGDSLSDNGNDAHLTQAKYGIRIPGPIADYTDGRFTDGFDTAPAAQNFSGAWIEQFAATLPSRPEVKNSLDGGTNYAYGFATTGGGTSAFTFGPGDSLFVNVDNIGQQITDYLATHPKINDSTLFIVWGGANDLIQATSANDIIDGAIQQTLNVQRLLDAGATQILIPNLPPLGLVPRFNGSPLTSAPATGASALYNSWLATGIGVLQDAYHHRNIHLYQMDVFSLFYQVVGAPASFSLSNVTQSSQGNPAVDPDSYLFWDDLHPTTHGHNILAHTAAALLNVHECKQTGHTNCASVQN